MYLVSYQLACTAISNIDLADCLPLFDDQIINFKIFTSDLMGVSRADRDYARKQFRCTRTITHQEFETFSMVNGSHHNQEALALKIL
jgi:hypothetical protein